MRMNIDLVSGERIMLSKRPNIHPALYFALGIVLMKSVSLLMLPIVTRFLQPEQFGALELLLAISDFATILVGFGMVDALYRFAGLSAGEHEERRIASSVSCLAIVFGTSSFLIGMLLSPVLHSQLDGFELWDIQLLVFLFSIDACLLIPLAWLKMKNQAFEFFLLTTGKAIGQALITWYFLVQGQGLTAVLLGGAISSLVLAAILIWMQYRQTGFSLDRKIVTQVLRYGMPLVVSGMAAFALLSADRWVISAVSTPHELGLYAVGKKLALICTFLMQPFFLWWSAIRFKVLKEENGPQRVAHNTSLGIALAFCTATLVVIGSPILMNWLIDPAYANAIKFVAPMALIYAIKQIAELANIGAYVGKSTVNVMMIDLFCALVALVCLYYFGQWWQVEGVIGAMLLAQILRVTLFYIISQRQLSLQYDIKALVVLALICISLVMMTEQLNGIIEHLMALTAAGLLLSGFIHFSGLANLTPLFKKLFKGPLAAHPTSK